jgi:hypothetical protein
MKFLVIALLSALAFAYPLTVDPASWPYLPACASFDPTSQVAHAPKYLAIPGFTSATNPDIQTDYLDAVVGIQADETLVGMWSAYNSTAIAHKFEFHISDPHDLGYSGFFYEYNSLSTKDFIWFSCDTANCASANVEDHYCFVWYHFHIGRLNQWGFRDLALDGAGEWNTGSSIYFNTSRFFQMTVGPTEPWFEHNEVVVFPIEITIKNEFDISTTTPLTVYGSQNLKASLLLFREYPYDFASAVQSLDLKFAFSVQYPFQVDYVKYVDVSLDIEAPTAEGGGLATLHDTQSLISPPSGTGPNYVYQYLATKADAGWHYLNWGYCTNDADNHVPVTWDGEYHLLVTLKCRTSTLDWCSLDSNQNWYIDQDVHFHITSNDICPFYLRKDPMTGKFAYHLKAGQTPLALTADPTTFETTGSANSHIKFIADDYIYFMLWGTFTDLASQTIRVNKLILQNFLFDGKNIFSYNEGTATATWYSNIGTTSIDCHLEQMTAGGVLIVPSSRRLCYNPGLIGPAGSKTPYYLPAVQLGFKLVASTFGLGQLLTPKTISATASIKFDYAWVAPASKAKLLVISPPMEARVAVKLTPPAAMVAPEVAGVSAGVVAGSAIGAVALVAVVAGIIVVRKKRASSPQKLTETNA